MKQRTEQKEDYLKEIFKNNGVRHFVPNKVLAEKLNVSAASVSEMINKLKKDGYVEYVSYKGVKLNENGMRVTSKIIYNHRIFESFLYQKLGYSLYEVHALSEEMEHIKDDTFFARLYQFLGEPKYCPHGGIISSDILKTEDYVIPITQYPENTLVTIKRFADNYKLLLAIEKIGLQLNEQILLLKKSHATNELLFSIDTHHYTFPIDLAEEIYGVSVS